MNDIFAFNERSRDSVKIAGKNKEKLGTIAVELEKLEKSIPNDFKTKGKLKKCANNIWSIQGFLESAMHRLSLKIDEIISIRDKDTRSNNSFAKLTNKELYKMLEEGKYDEIRKYFSDIIFNFDGSRKIAIQSENYKMIQHMDNLSKDSVCQGYVDLGNGYCAYADKLDKNGKKTSYLRVIHKENEDDDYSTEVSRMKIDGSHCQAMAYIPEEGVIIISNDSNQSIEVISIDKENNMNLKYIKSIENMNDTNVLMYDEENKNLVKVSGHRAEVYSIDELELLNKDVTNAPKPKSKGVVAHKLTDEESDTYYTLQQDGFACEGYAVIPYNGFQNEESHEWGTQNGNIYVVYDMENDFEPVACIVDEVGQEAEAIAFNEDKNFTVAFNYGDETKVLESEEANFENIKKVVEDNK